MRYCLFFLILLFSFFSHSQSLIANGNFEEENSCFEFKVNCAPEGWFASEDVFLSYFKDANRAQNGTHSLAITAGHSQRRYKRTFQETQLLCGMRKGNQYLIELYVKSFHPVLDSMGVYMPSSDFLFSKQPLQTISPSFYLQSGIMSFQKDSSWQKVSYVYTANGSEAFFVIANFSKRDITGNTGLNKENNFIVFIDNVSMRPLNPQEQLCNSWRETKDELYARDDRHEFLRQRIKKGKAEEPFKVNLTKNSVSVTDTVLLSDIYFESGSSTLAEESNLFFINAMLKNSQSSRIDSIVVEGHTDSTGTDELNTGLAIKRAMAVKEYLSGRTNVPVMARGYSFTKPVAPNDTEDGRRKNRRVEIFIYRRE